MSLLLTRLLHFEGLDTLYGGNRNGATCSRSGCRRGFVALAEGLGWVLAALLAAGFTAGLAGAGLAMLRARAGEGGHLPVPLGTELRRPGAANDAPVTWRLHVADVADIGTEKSRRMAVVM